MAKDEPKGDTPDLSEEEDKLLDAVWDRINAENLLQKEDDEK